MWSPHFNFALAHISDSTDIFFILLKENRKDHPHVIRMKTKVDTVTQKERFLPQVQDCFVSMAMVKLEEEKGEEGRGENSIGLYQITACSLMKSIYTITLTPLTLFMQPKK